MLNSETLNPHRLGFTYNLKGRDEACASFIKTETNEIFDCNFSNYGSDIRALSNAILRLINVNDYSEGLSYDEYLEKIISNTDISTENRNKAYFMWETCDAEYEIYLEKHDDKLLSIKIYETNDALGLDEVLKFNSCTYLYEFAKQVLTEMDKLVIFYGFQGYYDRWSEDFPVSSYLNLKSYVLINSKNGIFTKSVPNLNLPFKLELKLLNTLSAVKSDEKKCENIRNSG